MEEDEWEIAKQNTNAYFGEKHQKIQVGKLQKVSPEDKDLNLKVNGEYVTYLASLPTSVNEEGVVNVDPSGIRKDELGGIYQISNGITHKRTINGQEYVGIENILIPIEVVLAHESGHYLHDDKRAGLSIKGDKSTESRVLSVLSGGADSENMKDNLNIMGNSKDNENEMRAKGNYPLRYGYVSANLLKGGKVFYERKQKVLDTVKKLALVEQTAFDQENLSEKWVSLNIMQNHINQVAERLSPIDYEKIALGFMKFVDIEDLLTDDLAMRNYKKTGGFKESFFLAEGRVGVHDFVKSFLFDGGWLSDKNNTYKVQEKTYADGRQKREGQKGGQFSRSYPKIAKLLTYQKKDDGCVIC